MVARAHQVLSAILADAVRDRMIAANPATGIKLPRQARKRPVYLTHRQVADLAAASGDHEALVLLLAYTGLRWGEAVALRVADLDMLRRRVTVSENAVQVGAQIHVGTPKAHKQRSVPLPEFLLPYLARQCEGQDRDDLLFGGEDGATPAAVAQQVGVVRQGGGRLGGATGHRARPSAHRSQPGGVGGCQRQGGAADARARLGGHDAGHLRRPVR